MRVPNFVLGAPAFLLRYGLKLVLGGMALGIVCYGLYSQVLPSQASLETRKAPAVPTLGGLGVEEQQRVRQRLDEQKEDAEIRSAFPKVLDTLKAVTTRLTQTDTAREKETTELKAQLAELHRQLQAQAQKAASQPPARPATPPAPAPHVAPARPVVPPAAPPSLPSLGHRLYLLSPSEKPGRPLKPPRANHLATAHIPWWSFAPVRLVLGGTASSRDNSAIPILFSLTGAFHTPWQLQGPGRDPLRTAVEIQGCLAGGFAGGDMAESRVISKIEALGCVFPTGESFEQPVKGYIFGRDGRYGLPAVVNHHASAAETKAFLAAMLQELSAAFGLARSKVVVTSVTGGNQPFQGMQTQLDRLGQLYIQQMTYLLPTLTAIAGKDLPDGTPIDAYLLLVEGVTLEGLPTHTLVRGASW